MAWNPNIPQPNDLLSESQDQILQNFQALDPLFQGIDQFVLLPVQTVDPTVSTTQMALYTKVSALTGTPELFIERQSGSTKIPTVIGSTERNSGPPGWFRLANGLLIKYGFATATAGLYTYAFPVAGNIPVFTNIVTAQITTFQNNAPTQFDSNTFVRYVVNLPDYSGFQVWSSQRTTTTPAVANFNYFIVGT